MCLLLLIIFSKYTAYTDNSSLFFLLAEHSFTWNKIVLLKRFILVLNLNLIKKEKNIQKKINKTGFLPTL